MSLEMLDKKSKTKVSNLIAAEDVKVSTSAPDSTGSRNRAGGRGQTIQIVDDDTGSSRPVGNSDGPGKTSKGKSSCC